MCLQPPWVCEDFSQQAPQCTNLGKGPEQLPDFSRDVVDLEKMSDAVIRGLVLVLTHHNAPKSIRDELSVQLHRYLDVSVSEKVWLDHVKHALNFPLARYLRNDPPAPPSRGVFTPTGSLKRWIRNRLNAFNKKNSHLWYSWLQAKRAALPLGLNEVNRIMSTHFETLTSPDPCSIPENELVAQRILANPTFDHFLQKVSEKVCDRLSRRDPYRPGKWHYAPSSSSCFEATRSDGGAVHELQRIVEHYDPTFGQIHLPELHSMEILPHCHRAGRGISHNVLLTRTFHPEEEEWEGLDFVTLPEGPLECKVQVVLEPLKGRVITKGPALEYYRCKSLQKALHDVLREEPCFRLLGSPFCPTDLIGLGHRPGNEWFSVDYSAATDGLSWRYSKRILEKVIQYLPRPTRELALRVLGPHELHYPVVDPDGKVSGFIHQGRQTNGQLMGSVLSFPILCLANLGLYLENCSVYHNQSHFSEQQKLDSVLINGDDMVYSAPNTIPYYCPTLQKDATLWDSHIELGMAIGLEMSLGKAYHHPVYANVNSCSVHYKFDTESLTGNRLHGGTPCMVGYLNTGLVFGNNKVMSDERKKEKDDESFGEGLLASPNNHLKDEDKLPHIACVINTVLDGCLPNEEKKKDILRFMMATQKEAINLDTRWFIHQTNAEKKKTRSFFFHRSLFLPPSLGGMGVRAPTGFALRLSPMQKKYADFLHQRAVSDGLFVDRQLPQRGFTMLPLPFDIPFWVKAPKELYSNIKGELCVNKRPLESRRCPSGQKWKRFHGPELILSSVPNTFSS